MVVLGQGDVGKTAITVRYVKGTFTEKRESTINASCFEKSAKNVKLIIWDTAGQERYHALNNMYYKQAEGAMIVYDITDEDSFTRCEMWVRELRKFLPKETPLILLGNKCDKDNKAVTQEKAE